MKILRKNIWKEQKAVTWKLSTERLVESKFIILTILEAEAWKPKLDLNVLVVFQAYVLFFCLLLLSVLSLIWLLSFIQRGLNRMAELLEKSGLTALISAQVFWHALLILRRRSRMATLVELNLTSIKSTFVYRDSKAEKLLHDEHCYRIQNKNVERMTTKDVIALSIDR